MTSQVNMNSAETGELTYSADEMMTVAAARALRDGMTCFVGIGLPSAAANLARATHAPGLVRRGAGQPDPDEAGHAISERAGGGHGHHLVGGVGQLAHPGGIQAGHDCPAGTACTCSSSQRVNASRSRLIASQAT